MAVTEFAVKPGRLKPGSLTADGLLVGIGPAIRLRDPKQHPVVIPSDFGVSIQNTLARAHAIQRAGYVMCPAAIQPRILERGEIALIHRSSADYERWISS